MLRRQQHRQQRPRKNDKNKESDENDPVQEKITNILEEVKEKGERRNAYVNSAWTGPVDNTCLADKISLGKVENMAEHVSAGPADGRGG